MSMVGTPIYITDEVFINLESCKGARAGTKFFAISNMGHAEKVYRTHLSSGKVNKSRFGRYPIGYTYTTYKGVSMEIVNYTESENSYDVVSLDTGSVFKGKSRCEIYKRKNFLDPKAKGVNKTSLGEYRESSLRSQAYSVWKGIIDRCYNPNNHLYHRYGGRGVKVSNDWKVFRNFLDWYEDKALNVLGDARTYDIDKEILTNGGKLYSAEACCFIPRRLNRLLSTSNKIRGKHPIGVSWSEERQKFQAGLKIGEGIRIALGRFDTEYEAFAAYKDAKEKLIRELADEYFEKGEISVTVRDALYEWRVLPYPD